MRKSSKTHCTEISQSFMTPIRLLIGCQVTVDHKFFYNAHCKVAEVFRILTAGLFEIEDFLRK